jgi:hypothetical protein
MDLQPDETPQPLARRRTRGPSNQRLRANFPIVVLHGRVPPPSKPLVADWRKAGSAIKVPLQTLPRPWGEGLACQLCFAGLAVLRARLL